MTYSIAVTGPAQLPYPPFLGQHGGTSNNVNSPVCFAVFINDLLADLRANKKNNDIILSNVLAYADDIVLISDDENDLQPQTEVQ